jgi:hypothetical protein
MVSLTEWSRRVTYKYLTVSRTYVQVSVCHVKEFVGFIFPPNTRDTVMDFHVLYAHVSY